MYFLNIVENPSLKLVDKRRIQYLKILPWILRSSEVYTSLDLVEYNSSKLLFYKTKLMWTLLKTLSWILWSSEGYTYLNFVENSSLKLVVERRLQFLKPVENTYLQLVEYQNCTSLNIFRHSLTDCRLAKTRLTWTLLKRLIWILWSSEDCVSLKIAETLPCSLWIIEDDSTLNMVENTSF